MHALRKLVTPIPQAVLLAAFVASNAAAQAGGGRAGFAVVLPIAPVAAPIAVLPSMPMIAASPLLVPPIVAVPPMVPVQPVVPAYVGPVFQPVYTAVLPWVAPGVGTFIAPTLPVVAAPTLLAPPLLGVPPLGGPIIVIPGSGF